MRKILKYVYVTIATLLLLIIPAGSSMQVESSHPRNLFSLTSSDTKFVDSVLANMSLREKCAQMIMPNANGVDTNTASGSFLRLKKFIEDYKIGGLIFFKGLGKRQVIITNKLQALSKIPLLVASDFERGLGMRLDDEIEFPYNMAFAAAGEPMLSYYAGKIVASRARSIGVQQNYAPLMDINRNSRNPVINIRAYSDEPAVASLYGSMFIRGLNEGKMISTAKHFPGHGATNLDSHNDLPLISLDKNELTKNDLQPFSQAIKSGVQSVMVGHLEVPSLEGKKNLPATFSKNIISDLLIKEMNFDGLVVTDAMNMKSITDRYSQEEAAKLAVIAGNDILIYPENEEKTLNGLVEAVLKGDIKEERINASVRKILSAKKYLGLFDYRWNRPADNTIGERIPYRFAKEVAERSITLVKDEKKMIPLNLKKYKSIACITISNSKKISDGDLHFQSLLKKRIKQASVFTVTGGSSAKDYKKALNTARKAQVVLLPSFVSVRTSSNSINFTEKEKDFIDKITALKKPVIMMSFGSPYIISDFKKISSFLCAYGNPRVSQEAMIEALMGDVNIDGKLPVSIPGTEYANGTGLERSGKPYFTGNETDTLYNFTKVDALMNGALRDSVFPGGVVLVGYRGKIIYNKAFGNYSYDNKVKVVNTNSYFDLASLTKVTATTPAAMLLCDEGKLNLDDKVIKYLREFGNNGKEKITIRNLLLHNSGLPAFKPFYKNCRNAKEEIAAIMNSELEFAPGQKYLYSDLGMIVLQKVIEKITKQPLDRYLKSELYDKLGMKNTFFNPPKNKKNECLPTEYDNYWRKRLIQGEVHDETASLLNGVAGNAGLFSTATDLAIYVNTLLNNGVYDNKIVFKPETVKSWTMRQSNQSSRGLGWDTKSDEKSSAGTKFSKNSFGHTGFTGTSIWVDKDKKLFVILLTNRVHPSRDNNRLSGLRPKLHDAVVKAVEYF